MIRAATLRNTARRTCGSIRTLSHTRPVANEPKKVTIAVPVVKQPPPPPPIKQVVETPKTKRFSWFKWLFNLTLATSVLYGGTLYVATKNDKVLDFVIDKNLPYYEELLDFIDNGSVDDIQKWFQSLSSRVNNLSLPSKDQLDQLTSQIEKSGGGLLKDTKDKLAAATNDAVNFNSKDATPAQQLQKPVEIESVKKDVQQLPLIKFDKSLDSSVDSSVRSTVEAFNTLISSIDASKIGGGVASANLIKTITENVEKLAVKLNSLSKNFDEELQSKLKVSQTELLSSYTKKELELTENFLEQFNGEKAKLEQKLNARLAQEVQATKEAISQAAVNAVSMVRVEQTKNFEKLIKDKIDQERNGRLANLEGLNGRLDELEQFAESLETQLVSNHQKSLIHGSLVKLKSALFTSDSTVAPKPIKPFLEDLAEVSAVSKDEIIELALHDLQAVLDKESTQSVLTNSQLLSRWELLVPELRSASLLPPNAGLLGHLTSAFFSKFLFSVKGSKPDGKDIESVIGRVEASLVRGELDAAVEEVTNLKGWARRLSDDWVLEGRKRLEVEFLINLIEAESRVL